MLPPLRYCAQLKEIREKQIDESQEVDSTLSKLEDLNKCPLHQSD